MFQPQLETNKLLPATSAQKSSRRSVAYRSICKNTLDSSSSGVTVVREAFLTKAITELTWLNTRDSLFHVKHAIKNLIRQRLWNITSLSTLEFIYMFVSIATRALIRKVSSPNMKPSARRDIWTLCLMGFLGFLELGNLLPSSLYRHSKLRSTNWFLEF